MIKIGTFQTAFNPSLIALFLTSYDLYNERAENCWKEAIKINTTFNCQWSGSFNTYTDMVSILHVPYGIVVWFKN